MKMSFILPGFVLVTLALILVCCAGNPQLIHRDDFTLTSDNNERTILLHFDHFLTSDLMKMSYILPGFVLVTLALIIVCFRSAAGNPQFIHRDDFTLSGDSNERTIRVDPFGRGDSLTVQGARDMVPQDNTARVKVLIIPGVHREKVLVPKNKPYISLINLDDRRSSTIITWNDTAGSKDHYGRELGTIGSASVTVEADYFCANGITIQNPVIADGGPGKQAVALRMSGDKAVIYRVKILGSQDTLLDDRGLHFYYGCHIQGDVDYIFGSGTSLFEGEGTCAKKNKPYISLINMDDQVSFVKQGTYGEVVEETNPWALLQKACTCF